MGRTPPKRRSNDQVADSYVAKLSPGASILAKGEVTQAAMLTDPPPRHQTVRVEFLESDRLDTLQLPQDDRLRTLADSVERALKSGERSGVRQACADFLAVAAGFYGVRRPQVRVLAARPLRVREGSWGAELFGDYDPKKVVIRVWMRTTVRKKVTSFGTFLILLCYKI